MTLFCEVCGAGPDEISFYPEVSLVEYTCNNGHFTSRTCRADCCDRVFLGSNGPRFKNGLCQGHYQQEKAGREFAVLIPKDKIKEPCSGPANEESEGKFCGKSPYGNSGLCNGHYQQKRAGKTLKPLRVRKKKS